ncbi:MAG TPA: hypothetical protein DCQ06_05100 [Myxococcales bacterium]|nr:hypothetical protein [Myxococcales bacterium]
MGEELQSDVEQSAEPTEVALVEAVLVPPRGLVPTILVLMVAISIAAVMRPNPQSQPPEADLSLMFWTEGTEELLQARDRAAKGLKPSEAAQDIADKFALWLAQEATVGIDQLALNTQARKKLASLEEQVRDYALRHGPSALHTQARLWARSLRLHVQTGLRSGSFEALNRAAPGLLERLRAAGLLRWKRSVTLMPAVSMVIEALAESRYLQLANRVPTPRPELSSRLRRTLDRFQVEAHSGLTLQRKLQLTERLSQMDPAWPSVYVTAVLLARSGKFKAAISWFDRSADTNEYAARSRHNARWCRAQLRLNRRRR